jgi:hypothetical protein
MGNSPTGVARIPLSAIAAQGEPHAANGVVPQDPSMLYAQLRDTLIAVTERARIVGFDLVEVNPQLDVATGVTSYLAAHTIIEFLGHLCDSAAWKTLRVMPRGPLPST